MNPSRLDWLGLAADVKTINVLAYLVSSFFSVASLVFLNASTSFVLTSVVRLPFEHLGRVSGSLVFLDELVALPAVLVWGRLADIYGFRFVSVTGHILVAIALSIFVQATSPTELYLARAIVSIGFAALTTMLSAILAAMTVARSVPSTPDLPALHTNELEITPLLPSIRDQNELNNQRSARLSGILGFSSGLGALFAVFLLLRLPPHLANGFSELSPRDALRRGVKISFYITSSLTFLVGLFLITGLRRRGEPYSLVSKTNPAISKTRWQDSIRALGLGFTLCWQDRSLLIAYAAGFSARATTIAVSAFIPVLVNQFYISSGRCQLDKPGASPEEVKKGCHAAFALASALTGTVQLSALLLSPIVGWLASHYSQPALLAFSNAIGAMAFLTIGVLPTPHHFLMWPICVGLGIAQISGIVVSLSLCASGRSRLQNATCSHKSPDIITSSNNVSADAEVPDQAPQTDISGAIAGVYSLCGGLGILVGSVGGILADWEPRSPFLLTGVLTAAVSFLSFGSLFCRAT